MNMNTNLAILGTLITGAVFQTPAEASAVQSVPVQHVQTVSETHNKSEMKIPTPVSPVLPPLGKAEASRHQLNYLLAQRTTNYHHASASQAKNMDLLAKRLNGILLRPGETFSYFKTVGPYTAANGFHWGRAFQGDKIVPSMGGGVCQGASTLYSVLLRTDLTIVERHQHSLTVPYLPPGEDATVASTYLNFRFKNTHSTPVYIAATTDPGKKLLTVALWGAAPSPQVQIHHQILKIYPFHTITRQNAKLDDGEKKLLFPGQSGVKAHTWVELKRGNHVEKRDRGIDTYRPSPRIYEVGPKH